MSDSNHSEDGAAQGNGGPGPGDEGAGSPIATESGTSLEEVLEERDRIKDQLLRTAADLDNFRKRARRDVEEAQRRGREDALREVLPVIDNLERAVAAAEQSEDAKSILDGVRMVLKLFEDTASRMRLERVPAVGERFDPTVHEAVQQEETADHPAGNVIRELLPGYRLGERLLRAAMVVVARPPQKPLGSPPQPETEGEA